MRNPKRIIIFIISILLLSFAAAGAQTYTWVDKNGVTRFTDTPPPAAAVRKYKAPAKNRISKPRVELFVTEWCPYCKKAEDFFRSKGVAFVSYDIEKDKNAAIRKRRLDERRGVPFAIVNGKYIHGYSPEAYEFALYNR